MTAGTRVLYTSAVAAELGELAGEPVGIGLCAALLGTAALIARLKPDLLVFVGTAGALPARAADPGARRTSCRDRRSFYAVPRPRTAPAAEDGGRHGSRAERRDGGQSVSEFRQFQIDTVAMFVQRPDWPPTAESAPPIGSVVQVSKVLLGDAALALGLGYAPRHPGPLTTPLLPAIRAAVAITNLAVTTDPALAALHANHSQVENMEAYGVALACEQAGVRWACVLGITNVVGPDAHAQWLANRAECEAAARTAALVAALASFPSSGFLDTPRRRPGTAS